MSEGQKKFPEGSLVWVPCDQGVWKPAEVLASDNPKVIKVHTEDPDGTVMVEELPADTKIYIRNADLYSSEGLSALDDLTQLTHLHEPAVLHSLNVRFDVDTIYTYTGPILIAANPFKTIPSLYDEDRLKYFLTHPQPRSGARVPHVFASAELAYRGMIENRKRQTILISGESGAGKTESTKFVMRLLAMAGSEDWDNRSQIENQVLQSNPLLEAFGNSKTLRNDNSSRFGKFIDMQFNVGFSKAVNKDAGRLVGAKIETYLLETVRCCHQLEGERNYHSFYQGCLASQSPGSKAGVYSFPTLLKDKLPDVDPIEIDLSGFASSKDFKYLTRSTCHSLARMDDLEEFELTVNAMKDIGIPVEEINDIYRITGAVLRLGNIEYNDKEKEEVKLSEDGKAGIALLSKLLGVEGLEVALTSRTLKAGTEKYLKPLTLEQGEDTRDSLGRALYNCMFKAIVQKTNESIGYDENVDLSCGVLDIFGFECFDYNSFEQLCINFTNERLQQFFNTFIFKEEEKLYELEGIEWSSLDFPDNQDSVDLLQKRPWGIMPMLDEECLVPQGSDRAFCNKIKDKHKGHVRFDILKTKPDWFIINHFAGPVPYCSDGFLEKNKDTLSEDIIGCIKASTKPFVANLFEEFLTSQKEAEKQQKGRKQKMTVSLEFRTQLQYLMDSINLTEPHFIRCVKPNSKNKPDLFERPSVCEQLRYGGVLQAVQVSRAGFPVRTVHADAINDYKMLGDKNIRDQVDALLADGKASEASKCLFSHLDVKFEVPKPKHASASWSVGQTMVFFKHEAFEIFSNEVANVKTRAAVTIQAYWKGRQQRQFFLACVAYTITIQSHARGFLARRRARALREEKAALTIQKNYKMITAVQAFQEKREACITIQKRIRGCLARQKMKTMMQGLAKVRLAVAVKYYLEKANFEAAYEVQLRKREQDEVYQAELAAEKEAERIKAEEEKKAREAEEAARREAEKQELEQAAKRQQEELERVRVETVAKAQQEAEEEMARLKEEMKHVIAASASAPGTMDPQLMEDFEHRIAALEQENTELHSKLEDAQQALAASRDEVQALVNGGSPSATSASSHRPGTSKPATEKAAKNNSIHKFISSVFGGDKPARSTPVPLAPSVMADPSMLDENMAPSIYETGEIRPYQEVNDIDSAVTYICFGQEQKHRDYVLLAAGGKDGCVIVYRCYRTKDEVDRYVEKHGGSNDYEPPLNMFPVHTFMNGHNKAITSIFFTMNEDNLVTTSVDRTVRFWSVETGDMLKVFSDSSPALVAHFLPFNPSLFVAANSNSILRVVNIQNGHVLQKLKFESEVRAMKFDDLGMHLVAGTKSGTIHVLEAAESTQLKFRFKIGLSRAAITHITFVPARADEQPQIAVNACDSTMSIMDCLYTSGGVMTHLVVKHRLKIPQSLLPLRSCYSGYGSGWLISASEDRHVYVYSMSKKKEFPVQLLKHHKYPVLTVAVNDTDTLLASADTCGKIVLWRRFDFSHLQE